MKIQVKLGWVANPEIFPAALRDICEGLALLLSDAAAPIASLDRSNNYLTVVITTDSVALGLVQADLVKGFVLGVLCCHGIETT